MILYRKTPAIVNKKVIPVNKMTSKVICKRISRGLVKSRVLKLGCIK
jgi:hypothetical protein